MLVPDSLRKIEQKILGELKKANLAVIFSITNYNADKNTVDYVLVSVGDVKDVPLNAQKIVHKNLDKWKSAQTC